LYVILLDFSMNELTASENLVCAFGFSVVVGTDTRLTIAFSLAVRKGLSLGSAVMCVVTPIVSSRAAGVSESFDTSCCARERFLRELIMTKMIIATTSDSTPELIVSQRENLHSQEWLTQNDKDDEQCPCHRIQTSSVGYSRCD
jgi:hypothetical protein